MTFEIRSFKREAEIAQKLGHYDALEDEKEGLFNPKYVFLNHGPKQLKTFKMGDGRYPFINMGYIDPACSKNSSARAILFSATCVSQGINEPKNPKMSKSLVLKLSNADITMVTSLLSRAVELAKETAMPCKRQSEAVLCTCASDSNLCTQTAAALEVKDPFINGCLYVKIEDPLNFPIVTREEVMQKGGTKKSASAEAPAPQVDKSLDRPLRLEVLFCVSYLQLDTTTPSVTKATLKPKIKSVIILDEMDGEDVATSQFFFEKMAAYGYGGEDGGEDGDEDGGEDGDAAAETTP